MGLPRFFCPAIPERGPVLLDPSESHHAARVLRLQGGDDVLVFDGQGHEGWGRILELQKKSVAIEILGRRFAPRDFEGRLQVAVALPKGDRQRNVIEKLVELGVDRLIPLACERSVARMNDESLTRLHRYALESCKQCQRNRTMTIEPCQAFIPWVERMPDKPLEFRWLVHPSSNAASVSHVVANSPDDSAPRHDFADTSLLFAIGPEGGFSDAEVEAALAMGFHPLSLGERILRVETAVAMVATLGSLRWSSDRSNQQSLPPGRET